MQKQDNYHRHNFKRRNPEYKNQLRNKIRLGSHNHNCVSVSLKLNFTEKNSERIHSHSVKIDPQDGKIKV